MELKLEGMEEFLALLEAEEGKDLPVFVGQLTQRNEMGQAATYVVLQYQYDHGMVVTYSEIVGTFWMPRDEKDEFGKSGATDLAKQLETKKAAVLKLLKDKGYSNIVPGIWV